MNAARRKARVLLLFLLILCPFCYTTVFAQTGSLSGVIVDSESGETLIGANVIIEGTNTGTTSDLDGHFELKGIEPGTYAVRFSYLGYHARTVVNLSVVTGETTRLDISLEPESIGLGEVVVEARALRDTEASLLRERQKALAVSDAISAEAISRSGSSDAAEAMEKVTGASVVDGKYVYIRGLGERYSSTQLNGVELPTADPDRKAVQFDLFPSHLLENIVTVKTFTPDQPGSFSGGLVNIGTRSFPEQLSVQFSASTSVNTQTSFSDKFLTYEGSRALPDLLKDRDLEIPSVQRARLDPGLAENLDRISKSFNNVMGPELTSSPVNQQFGLSAGNQLSFFGNRLGYILNGTYGQSYSSYQDGFTGRYAFAGNGSAELGPDLLLDDRRGTEESSLGGLAHFTYRIGKNNEIGLNSMYTRTATQEARLQSGQWEELDIADENSLFISRTLGFTERLLYSVQLRGRHLIPGLAGSEVEWTTSRASTNLNEPDRRFVANTRRLVGGQVLQTWTASGFRDPSRLFRDLNETSYHFNLDVGTPFKQWNGRTGRMKVGAAYQRADRTFSERSFEIVPSPFVESTGDPSSFFARENMGVVGIDTLSNGRLRYNFGNVVREVSKPKNNYSGLRDIVAGYAMLELPVTPRLRAIGGARLESTLIEVNSEDPNEGGGRIDNLDLLPSLNLVYQIRDNLNLRAAATRTLARPTFREIAPFESFEFLLGNYFIGNPDLKRTRITNYDLRGEWFTRPGEILAVSTFYKTLIDPIERAIIGGTNGQIRFQNVPEATVYGVEVEIRQRLDRVINQLNNVSVGLNASLIRSTIDIPGKLDGEGNLIGGELFIRRQYDPGATTRALQGQSPYIVNADLSYENIESGTTAGFYYRVFGPRLSQVSIGPTPDVYERPQPVLDFTMSQRVLAGWTLKFSATNLLDSGFRETYRWNGNDFIYQQYDRGRTFSIGVVFTPAFTSLNRPSPGDLPAGPLAENED